ncbi:hypothetical protein [Azospirillum doebereinerae]
MDAATTKDSASFRMECRKNGGQIFADRRFKKYALEFH